MQAHGLLSVPEAASELGVNEARVRALLKARRLDGVKQAGRWLVDARSVDARKRAGKRRGRRLEPANAWAALALASGLDAPWVGPDVRYRMRRLLDAQGLAGLRPALAHRATPRRFRAHRGVLRELAGDPALAPTGISAAGAYGLGLVSGEEVDAYVPGEALGEVARRYALVPDEHEGNVVLRELDADWPLAEARAPLAAVALDLAEDDDPRSARIGGEALARLDAERAWAARA
jgi:hypothetical protein